MSEAIQSLEWVEHEDKSKETSYWADHQFGSYAIERDYFSVIPWGLVAGGRTVGNFDTVEAAQKAAQGHFEQRVRSCLVGSRPTPTYDPTTQPYDEPFRYVGRGDVIPNQSAESEDQCEYCGKVGGHNEICVMNEVIRLRDAVRSVLKTFRADEAAGYRSRDRQYAITILGNAAEDFPAPLHDKSQLSPLAAAIYSADGLYLSPLDAEKVAQIVLSFREAPQQSDTGKTK